MTVRVYVLRNRTSDLAYVGSTEQELSRRFTRHRSSRRSWLKGKTNNCSSFPIVADPTAYIELLEECEEGVRYERERWWIENTPNCVNLCVPGRDMKEYQADWYQKNKEKHDARNRAYVEAHREERRAYMRAYREKRKLKVST